MKVLWREQKLPRGVKRPFLLPHLLLQLRIVKMMKRRATTNETPKEET
ncbi:WSSV552 [White spot syndrome virus]|uniref:WSSV552 n=1 Tax=White spot syndrome virus TaxID=342409 RepID=A0A2I6SCL4_9VIRU|nr:WSSV552 [White spot syndrome virus]